MFTRYVKQRAAGDQTGQEWAQGEELCDERRRLDNVLEVIEDEQGVPGLQEVRDTLQERSVPSLTHVQRLSDRREDQSWVMDRGQRHEPDAIRKVSVSIFGDL